MTFPQYNKDRYSRPCAGISRFFAMAKLIQAPEHPPARQALVPESEAKTSL